LYAKNLPAREGIHRLSGVFEKQAERGVPGALEKHLKNISVLV